MRFSQIKSFKFCLGPKVFLNSYTFSKNFDRCLTNVKKEKYLFVFLLFPPFLLLLRFTSFLGSFLFDFLLHRFFCLFSHVWAVFVPLSLSSFLSFACSFFKFCLKIFLLKNNENPVLFIAFPKHILYIENNFKPISWKNRSIVLHFGKFYQILDSISG